MPLPSCLIQLGLGNILEKSPIYSTPLETCHRLQIAMDRIRETRQLLSKLNHQNYVQFIPRNFTTFPHILKLEFLKDLLSANGKCHHPVLASADVELALECLLTQWASLLAIPASGLDQNNIDIILTQVHFFYFFISNWINQKAMTVAKLDSFVLHQEESLKSIVADL